MLQYLIRPNMSLWSVSEGQSVALISDMNKEYNAWYRMTK